MNECVQSRIAHILRIEMTALRVNRTADIAPGVDESYHWVESVSFVECFGQWGTIFQMTNVDNIAGISGEHLSALLYSSIIYC